MSKLDVYLRSIERFGAAGAVLTSGQPVTLRFPGGDRQATQVTPHDQLVVLVREVAPPQILDQIDQQRPARFDVVSQGTRYAIHVHPRPGAWSVVIEPAPATTAAAPAATAAAAATMAPRTQPRAATPIPDASPMAGPTTASTSAATGDMAIERGQYDAPAAPVAVTASGSTFLDQLTTTARASRATEIFLASGAAPLVRAGSELVPDDRGPIDGDQLARELGVVAPAEARAAWADNRVATFAYSDGAGRVRVTLSRDRRGPLAALRLLHGEPPPLERLGMPAEVASWLAARGLVVIAGPSGAGKTTTLAALVRALGERNKVVVTLEDPIEMVHASPSISQRALGEHVPGFAEGVASAMREGADAIVVGAVDSPDAANAVVDAIAGGHLVLTAVVAPVARVAIDRMLDLVAADRRELSRRLCSEMLLGTITPIVGRGGTRTFEVASRGAGA